MDTLKQALLSQVCEGVTETKLQNLAPPPVLEFVLLVYSVSKWLLLLFGWFSLIVVVEFDEEEELKVLAEGSKGR